MDGATEANEASAPAKAATAAVSQRYGWPSRLRSYFIFDPLIWAYTVVLGIISIPVSLFGNKGRILHGFARFWSRLIMKTISSPTKVTGMEAIDTSKPYVYAVNHASALDIPVLYVYLPFRVPHCVQERIAVLSDCGVAPQNGPGKFAWTSRTRRGRSAVSAPR